MKVSLPHHSALIAYCHVLNLLHQHSVHPLLFLLGELKLLPSFQKKGQLDRTSIFRGVAGKEGVTRFSGGLQFLHKK